ncbi:MAG TPA: nitrilase-related carbon-nitrogen hydrolase, partial [Chloroflexota bacterium]
MRYTAAAVQFEPSLARPDLNVPRLLALAEEAAARGARLVVLPEMANIGYCFDSRAEVSPFVQPVPGPFTRQLEAIASRQGCVIVAGMGEVDEESDLYYNTAVVVGPHGYLGKYRKTHFFSADAKWAVEGDLGLPVWDTPVGRLGVEVCMDSTYPETGRLLALQ